MVAPARTPHDIPAAPGLGELGLTVLRRQGMPDLVRVAGELDCLTADELRSCLRVVAGPDASSTVAVDLTGVTFIDCAGLTPLLEARKRLGYRLRLRGVSPEVRRLLRLTGLSEHFAPHARSIPRISA